MARLALTGTSLKTLPGSFPTLPPAADALDIVFIGPAVAADGISFPLTGNEILLVRNIHATLAQTVTISSQADSRGRTGDIAAYSLAAGDFAAFGPFGLEGWRQTDGALYAVGSTTDIKFAVLRLP